MRKFLTICVLLLSPLSAFATFGAASAWDVRTTGLDTNGGAYDSGVGSPGTNESLGAGVAITITLTGTTTGTGSPAFTSTTHGPGNFVHIASGSGCTVGWYEILSQSAGTATFDHAMGTSTNVCVGTIGGSLLTPNQAATNAADTNTIWIKSGTYTITTSVTYATNSVYTTGYGTTHGDNGTKPLITTATNSVALLNTNTANNGAMIFTNLSLSNTAGTRYRGIYQLSAHGTVQTIAVINCILDGFSIAIDNSNGTPDDVAYIHLMNSEFKNNALTISSGPAIIDLRVFGSYFHDNGSDVDSSVGSPGTLYFSYSIFARTSSTYDMFLSANRVVIDHCTFANNSNATATVQLSGSTGFTSITNTIFYGSSVLALSGGTAAFPGIIAGAQASASNGFGGNAINYNNWAGSPGDVTLSTNPFTNSGSSDFSLNSTSGGGVLLKGAGNPGVFPGALSTGHPDIGAVQAASGGGGSTGGNYGISN